MSNPNFKSRKWLEPNSQFYIMVSTITRGTTKAHKGSSTPSIQGCCWNNGWLGSSSGGGDGSGHNSSSSLPCFHIYLSRFVAPIGTLHVSYNVLAAKSKILNCYSSQMIPHAINPVCWMCGARKARRSPALLPWPIGSVVNTALLNIYSIECYLFLWSYFDLKLWDFDFHLYMGLGDLTYQ